MDKEKRKQLTREYLNRKPEMGIIEMKCEASGEMFYSISRDTKADFNGNTFRLRMRNHSNKELQSLWSKHGKDGFTLSVSEILKYDDPKADQTDKLLELEKKYLEKNPDAARI